MIKPSPWKEYWLNRYRTFSLQKELSTIFKSSSLSQLIFHIKYIYKMASLPTYFYNLQKSLTPEQFYSLQQELANQRGMNIFQIPSDKLNRASLEYKRIEEILGDYGLPVENLETKQLINFAKFVCSF